MSDVEEKTLKQLKEEATALGIPKEAAESFTTKAQVLAVINTLAAKEAVKKVDSLEDKPSPGEKRQDEKHWRSKAEQMKAKLQDQPKIRVRLALESNEKPGVVEWRTNKNGEKYQFHVSGSVETVQLNGFKWLIPKGVPTEIPEQINEVLEKSMFKTMNAGSNISMDRIDDKTGRPMNEVI